MEKAHMLAHVTVQEGCRLRDQLRDHLHNAHLLDYDILLAFPLVLHTTSLKCIHSPQQQLSRSRLIPCRMLEVACCFG
eukprot:2613434-Amphidinium_carterae.1